MTMLLVDLQERVPADHPLRTLADSMTRLARVDPDVRRTWGGRPSRPSAC